jgi:hypothetical protein
MSALIAMPRGPLRVTALSLGSLAARVLLAGAFALAAAADLLSAPSAVEIVKTASTGAWLRALAAMIELAGAAMLLRPGLVGLGALLLTTTSYGALLGHLFILGDSPIESLLLLAAAGTVLWFRRRELLALYHRHLDRRSLASLAADLYAAFFWVGLGTWLAWSALTAVMTFEMSR